MTQTIPARGLLFDADGVLLDSDASVEIAWTRWARRWGLEPAVVLPMVHGRRSADTVALLIDGTDQQRALAEVDRFEVEDAGAVTPCPGAAELLASLSAGNWAVVTSGTRALVVARLAAAGLPMPAVLITAEDVPRGKPDPAGYLMAAESLGVPVSDCVVFEDSSAGIAAAVAAGAAVVGVSERALDSDAPLVVHDLSDVRWDGSVIRCCADRQPLRSR
ncbi:MAG: mannitol-/sugar-/sorbitol-6-phosphatase [Actinomycetota bacterium]|jgi:sugar-phosphatase|nr:mannitol-/sugar-/sorbitol-6-phosphatase [Actinomycetota bacterium]